MKLWKKVYLLALVIITFGINAGFLGIIYYTYDHMLMEEKNRSNAEFIVLCENISADIAKMEENVPLDAEYFAKFLVAYNSYYDADTQLFGIVDGELVTDTISDSELPRGNGVVIRNEEKTTIYISQILDDKHTEYRIVLRRTLDSFDSMWNTLQPVYIIGGVILSLGVSLLLALVVRIVLKPMDKLECAAKKVQEGDWTARVDIAGNNELAKLGNQFNLMAGAVEENIKVLEQQSCQKQELINNLAHEINTPITSIQGFADYMKMSKLSGDEQEECLEFIANESKRLKDISSTLLNMARLGNSQQVFSIKAMCDRLSKVYKNKFEGQCVHFEISCKIDEMTGNEALIESLIRNLINNAYNATLEKNARTIIVTVYEDGGCVGIKVSDNGCGIADEHITQIFEPFYRVDKARSRANGGSGLGLSFCKKIVEMHKGSIDVESIPDKGTTFLISLPFHNLSENI